MGVTKIRTAEDRADNINRLKIMIGGCVEDALRDGHDGDCPVLLDLHTRLQAVVDLLAELEEAKLARAKLELRT